MPGLIMPVAYHACGLSCLWLIMPGVGVSCLWLIMPGGGRIMPVAYHATCRDSLLPTARAVVVLFAGGSLVFLSSPGLFLVMPALAAASLASCPGLPGVRARLVSSSPSSSSLCGVTSP